MKIPTTMIRPAIAAAERGRIPDAMIRWGIRRMCRAMKGRSHDPAAIDGLVAALGAR